MLEVEAEEGKKVKTKVKEKRCRRELGGEALLGALQPDFSKTILRRGAQLRWKGNAPGGILR